MLADRRPQTAGRAGIHAERDFVPVGGVPVAPVVGRRAPAKGRSVRTVTRTASTFVGRARRAPSRTNPIWQEHRHFLVLATSRAPDWPVHDRRLSNGRRSMSRREAPTDDLVDPTMTIDEIVAAHSDAVFRLARSVVQDAALADDVTQETFIKVWRNLDSFRGDSSMRSWVLRIAHNTAVSTLRTIRDRATDPVKLPDAQDPIGTPRVVEGRAAADQLSAALVTFDELTRGIVVLREIEGMSYEEIADALDVPVPTVKTRLLRARRRLSTILEGWRA